MSDEEEFDQFKLSSGLPLSGATVVLTGAEFCYDNTYNADVCVARLTFQPEDGDEASQLYSVGKQFEPTDRGSKLAHKSGKQAHLNDNSNYGRWVKAFTEMDGAADAMAETRTRGSGPFDAEWMVGMSFKLGDLPLPDTNFKEGTNKTGRTLIVPVEYLGANGEAPAPKKGGKLAPRGGKASLSATAAAAAGGDEDFGIDDADVLKKLIKAAIAADDFDAFTDAALEVDGVQENKAWAKAVMSSKPGSLWATHGGE